MKILFLSISNAISNLENRGIYPDLLREFAYKGHEIFIVCPAERRQMIKTNLKKINNVSILAVRTLNITKTNIIEKGISMILIEYLFDKAIQEYFGDIKYELILYATPPITFNRLIKKIKNKHQSITYLLLKDIFPQNAVDLGLISKYNPLYYYFRKREIELYRISDFIGCMSPANVSYLLNENPEIPPYKVEICPNSIKPISYIDWPDPSQIKRRYNIPVDKVICIYGGNLGKGQGIDFLLKVIEDNKKRQDVFFVIAGSGTEVFKVENFIKKKRPTNMLFLGYLPKNEFDEIVYASDIGLIFLDKRFTIPNYPSRLLNYLEFKKPVLMAVDGSTDVGKIAENNNYGYYVEFGDIINFNKRLNELVVKPNLRKEMGIIGYNFLLNNYTVSDSYNVIMQHFK